jgi:O-antigen/teichoic acid export membrane protein
VYSDRFFLRHFGNLSKVGVYSLAYKLAGILTVLVTGPFTFAWQWQQFEIAKREDGKKIQARIATYQTFISLFLGLGISVLANEVLSVLAPPSYARAERVIPILVLSYVFANVRVVVSSGVLVQRNTMQMATVFALSTVADLALNWWLIPPYGMLGAAIATAAAYGVSLVLAWAAAQRVYHIRYEYGRNAAMLGAATALYLVSEWVEKKGHLPLISSALIDVGLTGVFLMLGYLLLDVEERSMMGSLWQAVTGKLGITRRPAASPESEELVAIAAKEGPGE